MKTPIDPTRQSTIPQSEFVRRAEGIYQYQSSGAYYALFNLRGKRIKQRLGTSEHPCTSLPEAKRLLADLKDSLDRTDVTASKKTLHQVIEQYRAVMPFSTDTTKYKTQYLDELKAGFPSTQKVRDIKTSDMRGFLSQYEKRLSPATINKVVTLCRDVFAYAIEDKIIARSPMDGIKYRKLKTIEKRLTPTFDQFTAIVASIRSQVYADTARHSADLVEFMGLAGMGQGECAGLSWGDINFDASSITIIRKKTGQEFEIPIYPSLRPLLERMKAERTSKAASDKVFSVANPKKALEAATRRLSLPAYTARALRRMFITRCIELGIDAQTIASWQGHRDGGVLILRVYGRVSRAHQAAMASKLI